MKKSENQSQKQKNKLYVLCIQSEDGKIERIFTENNYDNYGSKELQNQKL